MHPSRTVIEVILRGADDVEDVFALWRYVRVAFGQ